MRPRALSKSLTVAALAAVASLAACGGGSSGSSDGSSGDDPAASKAAAQKIIKQIIGPNPKANSARIDGTIDIEVKGVPRYKGTTEITAAGVYNLPSGATVPDFDVDVGLVLNDHAIGGALVLADGDGFIKVGDTGYKLPDSISQKIAAPASDERNGLTKTASMFYIRPQDWQKNATVTGDESLAGEAVTHLAADIRPDRFFLDASRLVRLLTLLRVTEAVGLPLAIGPKARAALERSTKAAKGEVWVAKSDNVLRKAHLEGRIVVAKKDRKVLGGMTSATLEADITVSEVGEAQKVAAPSKRGSYDDLQLTLDALGESIRNELRGK